MVPAAVGPPKARVAVPTGNMKLVPGLAPVQISGQPGPVAGARTIQLPNSVSKPGGGGAWQKIDGKWQSAVSEKNDNIKPKLGDIKTERNLDIQVG